VNYAILVGYDYLAVRFIGHPLPLRKIALASFCGYVISYNFGALLGGTSVRYRLYSAWGLSNFEIAKLLAVVGLTFWIGLFALAGAVFVIAPFPMPPMLKMMFSDVRPLGYFLLALVAGYLAITGFWKQPISYRKWNITLPTFQLSIYQILIASVDLLVAAAVLYVLLPKSTGMEFAEFVGIYLLAQVAVLFTHVPGGVGILESVILMLVAPDDSRFLLASLLIFRMIYYILPLIVAALMLAIHEAILKQHEIRQFFGAKPSVKTGSRVE
jgi:uncharacterized membrane protein YbhN (UPF0104 family)